MKQTIIYILLLVSTASNAQDYLLPSPVGEGAGVRLYTLQQCKEMALKNNITIHSADRDIESATEQQKELFTKYFPNVSAMAAYLQADDYMMKMGQMQMMKNGPVTNVVAMQPIYMGGQITAGNHLAKVGREVSELKHQLSANEVELQTERYYWQIVGLREKLCTLDATARQLDSLSSIVGTAVRVGVSLENDLLQVRLRQNEVASARIDLENGIRISRMLLAQHIGVEFTDGFGIELPNMEAQDAQPSANHAAALLSLPEYQLLERSIAVGRLQLKMERGKMLPTVSVGAAYVYQNLMNEHSSNGMLFAQLSVPISDWWGGSHAVKRKRIALEEAQESLADHSQKLTIRMQRAYDDLTAARRQMDIARQSICQADENLRLHTQRYKAGTITMTDLLQAQTLSQQSRDRLTETYVNVQLKTIEYRQATGQVSQ